MNPRLTHKGHRSRNCADQIATHALRSLEEGKRDSREGAANVTALINGARKISGFHIVHMLRAKKCSNISSTLRGKIFVYVFCSSIFRNHECRNKPLAIHSGTNPPPRLICNTALSVRCCGCGFFSEYESGIFSFWSGAPLCDRHRSNHNGTQVASSSSERGLKDFCSERGEIRRFIWRNRLLYVVFGT